MIEIHPQPLKKDVDISFVPIMKDPKEHPPK
jgi:hypothetical protein